MGLDSMINLTVLFWSFYVSLHHWVIQLPVSSVKKSEPRKDQACKTAHVW